ncbi:MAG: SCP2 sterol-binding domain-containing protein [Microthrixaceae bacterium]|nr:SCP2 sterol-binding domain-containing protein [Microthrixaceae bacterium]MCO5313423.1 SCP2 sterol-binding domain-containing protein [Microthrixaceae bacterium]
MAKFQFLTPEWVEAAKAIRSDYEGTASPHPVKANLIITEVPFGPGEEKAFMDGSGEAMEIGLGELDSADLTMTVDYLTAKAIIVEGNPQAGMQAFMAGKIKVVGDMTKMMGLAGGAVEDPNAAEVAQRIQDITE